MRDAFPSHVFRCPDRDTRRFTNAAVAYYYYYYLRACMRVHSVLDLRVHMWVSVRARARVCTCACTLQTLAYLNRSEKKLHSTLLTSEHRRRGTFTFTTPPHKQTGRIFARRLVYFKTQLTHTQHPVTQSRKCVYAPLSRCTGWSNSQNRFRKTLFADVNEWQTIT